MASVRRGPDTSGVADDRALRARYRRIMRFAALHLAQAWWFELVLPRFGLGRLAARNRTARFQRLARRFHGLAVDLGGLMIKVGQYLSSRLDVLPPEITKELEGLQDEVPPVDFAAIRQLIADELLTAPERAYASVDPVPLAAASLGQAHRARLIDADVDETGLRDVVIKVQRPGIDRIVEVDLRALRRVGRWLSHVRLVSDRVDAPSLVEEFAAISLEEIDYLHEAGNARRFAADFADDPRVGTPRVVWERTTRRVLTLEDVTAIKITDTAALMAAGIDPSEVADRFAAVLFDQLFEHGFFHGDPHPGNVFVTPEDSGGWHLTFIDFGMMAEVPPGLRRGLRRVLIAAATRDGRGLVDGMRDIGVLLPSADTVELERAMTQLFARFGGLGFAELQEVDPQEFRAFAIEFGDVIRSLPFQLPENFLLVVRAVSLLSGVCSALDPRFNIWDAVEPYAQRLIRDERGPAVQAVAREAAEVARLAIRLPRRFDDLADRLEDGRIAVQSPRVERRLRDLERMGRRILTAVLFAALLVAGTLLRLADDGLGTVLLVASLPLLLHAVFAGVLARRNGL